MNPDVFLVWDHFNGDREDAKRIRTADFEAAALAYAEADSDGWIDGLYRSGQHPIVVERLADGKRVTFGVEAEMVPHFRAVETSGFPTEDPR